MNISAYRAEKLAKAAQIPTASCSEIPSAESAPAAKNQGDAAQAAYTQAAKKALEEMLMEAQSTEKTTLAHESMVRRNDRKISPYHSNPQRFESSVTNVKECHLKSYRTSGQVDRSLIGLDG
ncbi:hypothetical protein Pst134EB_006645 [Puccinia striiformis f. sp. tritici]|nr:hypothetical protein Pst134EB_006645 [Puccinia striiformis f. sp. tritici]